MEEFRILMANSLSADANLRRTAEQTFSTLIVDPELLGVLFNYISSNENLQLKQAAAVMLMRYIKDYWYDDTEKSIENPHKVMSNETKLTFKSHIMNLMVSVDNKIVPTIKEMIVAICKEGGGYSNSWPDIMKLFASILKNRNHVISLDIYDIINKIIKRYRIEFKSHELFDEIKHTINEIALILTEDGMCAINFLFSDQIQNKDMCFVYMTMFKHILNIFYSLLFQDFPEYFEDNLKSWMDIIKGALDFSVPSDDRIILTLFLKLKRTAMRCLNLCCNNYSEDITDYHNGFIPSVWNLIALVKQDEDYAKLVRELLDYYKILFQYNRTKGFQQDAIQHLVDNLIIPNMNMTGKELDEFEENPINFLKVELEEADMDSNKYHAINLLKNMNKSYPNLTNDYIKPLINRLIDSYYANPSKNWMNKIISINLIFATMIKHFAQRIGATEVVATQDELANLIQLVFLKEFEITKPHVIARVYSMKFLTTFRLQIPQNWISSTINMLVGILNNSDQVIQTACLLTLEKILFMKDINSNVSLVTTAVNDEASFVGLIGSLVKITSNSLNIFAMRCVFRTIFLTSETYYKHIIDSLANSINEMLKMVIANPTEDQFNYFLFETIALFLTKTNRFDVSLHRDFSKAIRENLLFPIQNAVTDLMSYVFQIFTVELNIVSETELASESLYTNLLDSILYQQTNWSLSMKYLFKPFIAYVKVSFMKLRNFYLNKPENLNQTFVIVNSLLGLKHYPLAFDLLDSLMNFFDFNFIFENIKNIVYNLLIIHKNIKETNKKAYREFSKLLIVFLSKLLIKTNSKLLIGILEEISAGLTVSLLAELCEFLIDLDSNKNKKLVTYAYCQIINDYFSAFDLDTLRLFTWKLIQHLEKFYKINMNSCGEIEKLFDTQDFTYSANNYNKLLNADITVEFDEYKKIYAIDENQVFYSTMNNVKTSLNVNLVNDVYNNMALTDKQKEYIQNSSKNYLR